MEHNIIQKRNTGLKWLKVKMAEYGLSNETQLLYTYLNDLAIIWYHPYNDFLGPLQKTVPRLILTLIFLIAMSDI